MKKQTQNMILGGTALTAIAANAYFIVASKLPQETAEPAVATPTASNSEISATSSAAIAQSSSQTATTSDAASGDTLKDGTYTGAVTTTNKGDYQVQITVASGKISDIEVLLYPNDNPNSERINKGALPTYTEEALSKQSADIQQVSGASEAFKGFTGSLQDAINQANA